TEPAPPDVAPAPPRETSPAVSRETPPQGRASRAGPLLGVVLTVAAITTAATGLWHRRSLAPAASSTPVPEVTPPAASSPSAIAPTASPSAPPPAAPATAPAASATGGSAAGASSSRTRRPGGPPAWPSPLPV